MSPSPPSLLLINPNTSASVTALLEAAAQRAAVGFSTPVRVRAATASFGPRYITGEVGAAVAAHAALEAYAQAVEQDGPPSAVLLACFGDPGLFALRALSAAPVLGLAEASMRAAASLGPFVVLTGGAAWVPMLHRLAQALPLPAPMLGVHALPRSGGEMAAQPEAAVGWLAAAGAEALARWPQASVLWLGGVGLAGLAAPLAGRLPVPVLDNVDLALQKALQAALQATLHSAHMHKPGASDAPPAPPEAGPWCGLGPALAACLPADGTGLAQPGASTPP
jgi:allantoin racemase